MYEQVVRRYGRLDVIYNNMGLMEGGDRSALDTSLETWRRVQDANLTSIFLSCKHGIGHLCNTDPAGGSVINAASFLAVTGAATAQMAYAAAKAGVVQLSRDLGVHTARSGVRVNAVLFGPIDTAHQRAVFDRNPGALEKRLVHWPMGRFGTLAEAAGDNRLPRERRFGLHHCCRAAARRRYHRSVHRAGVAARSSSTSAPGGRRPEKRSKGARRRTRPATLKASPTGNASIKPAHAAAANPPNLPETPQFPWSAGDSALSSPRSPSTR